MDRFWIAVGQVVIESKAPNGEEGIWLSTRQVPSFVIDNGLHGAYNIDGIKRAARSVIMTATTGNIDSVSVHVEPLRLDEATLLEMLKDLRTSKTATLSDALYGKKIDVEFEYLLMTGLERAGVESCMLPSGQGGRYERALAITGDHDKVDQICANIVRDGTFRSTLRFNYDAPARMVSKGRAGTWVLSNPLGREFACPWQSRNELPEAEYVAEWAAALINNQAWSLAPEPVNEVDAPSVAN